MQHRSISRRRALALCASAAALGTALPALAADPVKLVVPFAPGGPVDQVARMIQPRLSEALGKTVVIDNRTGAGGTIGIGAVARSAPDGNTLLMASAAFVLTSGTMASLPYDPRRDLEPVAMLGEVQSLLVARNSLPVANLAELVAKGRAGQNFNFGSSGVGSSMHIGGELINVATGTRFVHVPYRGAALAITDLLGGSVDILNADLPVLLPYVRDGRVKALAVYDTRRAPQLPNVPTAVEAGVPQLQMGNWYGIMVPAGTPAPLRAALEAAVLSVARSPELAARLADAGLGEPQTGEAFRRKLDSEFERWVPFLRKQGIRSE